MCKVQFFIVIPLRNNVHQETVSHIQIALDVRCVLYLLYGKPVYMGVYTHTLAFIQADRTHIVVHTGAVNM